MKMIFLVDGDNNIGTGLQGIDLLTAEDTVLVFFGKGQTLANVKKLCAGTKAQVQYLESVKGGKNSLDFQIITELGVLVGRGEADFAYVISQDKGYEAAMSALHARYASTFREVALRPSIQDCLQAAFLLRAGTREELAAALARQYGPVQGQLAYEHLEALLTPPPVQEAAAPSPAPENKAASKPGKRRSRAAAKPAETAEPAPAQSAPQDAEEPAGTAEPAAPDDALARGDLGAVLSDARLGRLEHRPHDLAERRGDGRGRSFRHHPHASGARRHLRRTLRSGRRRRLAHTTGGGRALGRSDGLGAPRLVDARARPRVGRPRGGRPRAHRVARMVRAPQRRRSPSA